MPEETPIPGGEPEALPDFGTPDPEPTDSPDDTDIDGQPSDFAKHLSRNQKNFLKALVILGGKMAAARHCKLHRECHSRWLRQDKDGWYRRAFEAAIEEADERLYTSARAKALTTSDRLMERFLEARFPEFRRKQDIQVSGPNGGPIGIDVAAIDARCRQDPRLFAELIKIGNQLVASIPKPIDPHLLPPAAEAPPPTTNGHH